jgi:hypothetical protein
MERESDSSHLNEEQRHTICLLLSTGCDRETAAKFVGCSMNDIRRSMLRDPTFADEVHRAEAASELAHMRNVQHAARDKKDWRASVWWLERHSPERFGRRSAGTFTTSQLKSFIAQLASAVTEAVKDPDDLRRLLTRLAELDQSLQERCFGDDLPPSRTTDEHSGHEADADPRRIPDLTDLNCDGESSE